MRFSVIIPALDEEAALPDCLRSVVAQPGVAEIIVVDGASRDRTPEIASDWAARDQRVRLIEGRRGRGARMNAGARVATGDCLVFLHADTQLTAGAIDAARAVLSAGSVAVGCFRHRFVPGNWRLALISALHNLRFRLTRIIYGDQTMFITREMFWCLGGFPEQPMEDVLFSEKLVTVTRPVMLKTIVPTASRKFVQIGEFRALWQVLRILVDHQRGRSLANRQFFGNFR